MAIKATAAITLSSIRDLQSCTRYYLLQSSTLSPPARPTAKPPGGSWGVMEPSYTSGSTNSLYFCDLTVFSDDSFSYSDVSLSSSYEAAKAAYNQAVTAQSTASAAQSSADAAQSTADIVQANLLRVVRVDAEGLHVGDNQTSNEVLIDSESVNIVMLGNKYSRFAANYVQFGNYQLRQSVDGGLVFKLHG